MLNGPKSTLLLHAAAAAFGGFMAVLITRTAFEQSAWCITTDDHCLREWFAASSGWAAAAGALLAAGLTLPALRQQANEARRQADFTLGDASPTVDVLTVPKDNLSADIRIVNWNRRPMEIWAVGCYGPNWVGEPVWVEQEGERGAFGDMVACRVPGWEDRSERPPSATIRLEVSLRDRREQVAAGILIIGELIGERRIPIELKAEAPDLLT
ncbi:hypothetical protein [Aurantimonas sp. VKM B-3413]|uniref:hypothetical protein n=1 Tax=Aurantimonas sp. VKM B-3413 TaxID=2779401 RepID=UPI001E3562BF|nr:hypothetical protein [Aurantimonas sp. VKM B-3413]MCB8835954.1 hypothetical protein [Aurantimonas sp. VKM B-3413]